MRRTYIFTTMMYGHTYNIHRQILDYIHFITLKCLNTVLAYFKNYKLIKIDVFTFKEYQFGSLFNSHLTSLIIVWHISPTKTDSLLILYVVIKCISCYFWTIVTLTSCLRRTGDVYVLIKWFWYHNVISFSN